MVVRGRPVSGGVPDRVRRQRTVSDAGVGVRSRQRRRVSLAEGGRNLAVEAVAGDGDAVEGQVLEGRAAGGGVLVPQGGQEEAPVAPVVVAGAQRNAHARCRGWCFTINNPDRDVLTVALGLFPVTARYLVCQGERGASGTPHIQGFIYLHNAVRFSTVRGWFGGRAHLEIAKGTPEENKAYCSKEEGRDLDVWPQVELGSMPRSTRSGGEDLESFAVALAEGRSIRQVACENPVVFCRFSRGLQTLASFHGTPRSGKTQVQWLHGPTGSGKSRSAQAEAPEAFWKSPADWWWDGYAGEEVVIIDDFRPDLCKFHVMLNLFDWYPLKVPFKGGFHEFRSKMIIVTAPFPPEQAYRDRTDEDLQQLLRRIEIVRRFPGNVFEKGGNGLGFLNIN